MKTKGCMFIALIISGAAFGQQAAVKQSVKVESKTKVNSSSAAASGKAEIKAGSRVEGNAAQGNGAASASGNAEMKSGNRTEGSTVHNGEGATSATAVVHPAQEAILSGKENGASSAELINTGEGAIIINEGGNSQQSLLTDLNAAGNTALEHSSSSSAAAVGAAISTATEIKTTSTQKLEKVNERLMNTATATKGIGAGINTTVNNVLKIKAAPLKINTRIVSAAGLGIF